MSEEHAELREELDLGLQGKRITGIEVSSDPGVALPQIVFAIENVAVVGVNTNPGALPEELKAIMKKNSDAVEEARDGAHD